jgi:urate oxidase
MARLGENRYGKSRVRLSRITRHGDRHEFNEWTVHVLLDTATSKLVITQADNSKVLPTDTMKNTVYYVARGSKATTIEELCLRVRRLSARTSRRSQRSASKSRKRPGSA